MRKTGEGVKLRGKLWLCKYRRGAELPLEAGELWRAVLDQQLVDNLQEKEAIGPRPCNVSLWEPLPKKADLLSRNAKPYSRIRSWL
jgi:hypothetical protein